MKRRKIFQIFEVLGKPLYWAVLFSLRCFSPLRRWLEQERNDFFFHYHVSHTKTRSKLSFLKQKNSKRTIVYYSPKADPLYRLHRYWLPVSAFVLITLTILHFSVKTYVYLFYTLPSPEALRTHIPHLTTKILDRHGTLLYKMFQDENRTLVRLSDLPSYAIAATVSIEDKDFFTHKGVSPVGIVRATRAILSGQGVQGGSTITQQLVKTVLLTSERTITRKLKEAFIALRVERHFSKAEILQMYLNEVSYGGSIYGIEEASRAYFGISSRDLTVAQAAFLAGLPAAPSLYNPFGSYPERGKERQVEVLRRMLEDGKISPLQMEQAKNEKLVFAKNTQQILSPHFVMYIREQLAKEYGEETLAQGGLEITTTLDLDLQNKVQDIVTKEVASLARLKVGNGAALVTNPKTGEILAMVGSTNFFDTAHDGQVNVTIRERQPGSSIKPVTYAAALERGFTPATLIEDSPISYEAAGSPPYAPKNYDGRFHGNVTMRTALASSYNIPAVKTEASIGLQSVIEKGRQLGISTWDSTSRYGLSLTLGGAEVKMTDMATVYGTFANQGITVPLQSILEIKSANGKVLFENPCKETLIPCGGHRSMDPRIAYQITNILMDNTARSPAFGTHSVLYIPDHQVAVKTGTTNLLRDNWTDGYTTQKVVIVWVGNNDNSRMSQITSGIVGASPIWNKIISLTLNGLPPHVFPIPGDIQAIEVCRTTGRLACGHCSTNLTEYFVPGTEPTACEVPSPLSTPSMISGVQPPYATQDR